METVDLAEILAFATDIAQRAGQFTLEYFHRGAVPELKADQTPVTVADRGAEERLRDWIEKRFPRDAILGEEFGEKPGSSGARWILDPIDGTKSFIRRVPLYGVLIGYEIEGTMRAGVAHFPALNETLAAASGRGCTWNNEPARVSQIDRLDQACLLTTGTKSFEREGRRGAYERLRDACRMDRGWSDSYAYALVATGRADVALDPRMSIWDNAALLPILQEAGGTFTDWSGRATHTASEAVATNGRLLASVLKCLAPATANGAG